MSHMGNELEARAGRLGQALLSLDRQAAELIDRTAAYAFDDLSDGPSRGPWISTGLVERLIDAISGGGGTGAPAARPIAAAQPSRAAWSPGAY